MSDIDQFASSLLEESKRFLEKAIEADEHEAIDAFLHAAVLLAFSSLEAHVNAVADEIASREDVSVHDRGILLEKVVDLKNGEFVLKGNDRKITRLSERILLLHRLGAKPDVGGPWLGRLKAATELRNKLTHPKAIPAIGVNPVQLAIEAVIETIDALYLAVYKIRFPAAFRKLDSKLAF
jgi:hypothetical protein